MPKRRPDGLIPLHFRYRDVYGARREKTVYGRTASEAARKKKAFLADVDAALRIDQAGRTVASWADEWLAVYKKPSVSAGTYETYAHDIRLIQAAIGGKPLRAVTTSDIQRLVNARKGLSASAIRKTLMTAKALFQAAVENRMLGQNPCIGAKAIPGPAGTHRALEEGEVSTLLNAAPGHRFAPVMALMLLAGLRRGEAAAFNWDTDVRGDNLVVRRSVAWPVNQPIIKSPKSRAGNRDIPIFAPLQPFIGSGLALPGKGGYTTEVAFKRAHESFMKATGVTFRCHDLRHTYATMLFDAGVDVKTAQRWLGHEDPAVTMKIYTHLSAARQQQSTEAAQDYFRDRLVVKLVVNENANPENPSLLP